MIDLGATGNFILEDLVKRKGFPYTRKKDLYDLFVVDINILLIGGRRVEEETIPL